MTKLCKCTEPDWPMLQGDPWGKNLMSNYDHEVDHGVAQQLRDSQALATYPSWNFHAICWFADDQFHAAVHVFHVHRATISAATPEQLMAQVSEVFGAE